MSASLHSSGANNVKDPFGLDRLADELATRELSKGPLPTRSSTGLTAEEFPELPEHIPLSHADKYLTAKSFNVEEFLLARSHTLLPDLRAELRQYLAELKEELVKLINDDYEAFISLSTDLRDEGARMEKLKYPLLGMKVTILESKRDLQDIQNEIHEKLAQRAQLREEKALLHLLLKISESVTRLESLLLIASPDQGAKDSIEVNEPDFLLRPTHKEDTSGDDKFRGNRAKHLTRVAAEYTQLLYHARKARAENCKFVDEVQWRIDRVHSTLSSDLDHLFAQTVTLLTDPKENRGTALEKNKWIGDLTECLRTYDTLGLWRDAEDVIRKEVVRAFVKKTIHPSALATPHSPIVPHTPFQVSGPEPMTSTLPTHQIPYTPFTAFIPKQAPSRIPNSLIDLPQAHLLGDADNSLARLYNQLLRFVERDVTRIMDIAEKVSIRPSSEFPLKNLQFSPNPDANSGPDSREFQIMANVVWDEFGRSIMDEIGGIVFAAGRPNEFRQHYETTQAFIRSLELLAPSMHAVETMRIHPTFLAFERRWQLPVYFQLRWKEIAGSLEDVLSSVRIEPTTMKEGSFATPQASATWIAISACWSSEFFIPQLSHRFWKLTLQLLSRYKRWLEETLANVDNTAKPLSNVQQTTMSRSSTPGTSVDAPSVENTAAEDLLLRQYTAAIIDIGMQEKNVLRLWQQVISIMMPKTNEDDKLTEGALRESLSALMSFIPPLSSKIVAILIGRCCDGLLPVRSIPSQFRAMSNKRVPVEPSYFVPAILRPIKHFFAIGTAEGPGMLLKDSCLKSYSTEVFNNVTQRYTTYLTTMKKTEESLRRLNKRKKAPFSLFGNSGNAVDESKDEERIRSQMILDVEGFGREAESLLVDVDSNPYFLSLKEVVYAPDPE